MRNRFFFVLILMAALISFLTVDVQSQQAHKPKPGMDQKGASLSGENPAYPSMPGPGKKVPIGDDFYFIYGFDKKPKLGTVIVKVEIFTKEGKKDTSLTVKGESGMPSMKGAHESGDQPFKLSQKGDYLLPINIVMPGDWEIRMTILKEGKVIFRGSHQFDV